MKRVFIKTEEEFLNDYGVEYRDIHPGIIPNMEMYLGKDITDKISPGILEDIKLAKSEVLTTLNDRDFGTIGMFGYSWNYHWFRIGENLSSEEFGDYKIKQNGLFSI